MSGYEKLCIAVMGMNRRWEVIHGTMRDGSGAVGDLWAAVVWIAICASGDGRGRAVYAHNEAARMVRLNIQTRDDIDSEKDDRLDLSLYISLL